MKNLFAILTLILLFGEACNTQPDSGNNNAVNPIDSVASKEDTTIQVFGQEFIPATLPYVVDSMFFSDDNLSTYNKLGSSFATEKLKNKLENPCDQNVGYYLIEFLHIDSCLQKMTEEEFDNTLDIGMMKKVKLYACHSFPLSNGNTGYTWIIDFSTYEACPYSAGKILIFTIFDKAGLQVSSLAIGEISGGGDAPYFTSTELYSLIEKDFLISMNKKVVEGGDETDDGGTIIETKKSELKYQLIPETGELKKIKEKIEKPEKRVENM